MNKVKILNSLFITCNKFNMYDVKRVRIVYTYTIKIRNEIIMKIVEVKSKNGINFMILDGNNEPIVDAVRYLKYLDSVNKSLNTKKTYAYALKIFVYLESKKICYKEVSFDNFVDFIRWMKTPFEYENVPLITEKEKALVLRQLI